MEIVAEIRTDPVRAWSLRQNGSFGGSVGLGEREFADMLVLSRKKNETIYIGDDVAITVTAVRGDKVRIGIVAPQALKILRGELITRIERELSDGLAVDVETGKLIEVIPGSEASSIDATRTASNEGAAA